MGELIISRSIWRRIKSLVARVFFSIAALFLRTLTKTLPKLDVCSLTIVCSIGVDFLFDMSLVATTHVLPLI